MGNLEDTMVRWPFYALEGWYGALCWSGAALSVPSGSPPPTSSSPGPGACDFCGSVHSSSERSPTSSKLHGGQVWVPVPLRDSS